MRTSRMRDVKLAKVTSKGRTTIPKAIRMQCSIHEGDVLVVTLDGNRMVMAKVESLRRGTLRSLDATMGEWLSPADEAAYGDL